MADPEPDPEHRRRPRYRGTHPRAFQEKYKEHAPERYPELVEHVRGRGMTPAGQHIPIMVEEVLAALAPRPPLTRPEVWVNRSRIVISRVALTRS